MLNASQTEPGKYYRRTKNPDPGHYLMRPAKSRRNTARAFVDRMLRKRDSLGSFWLHTLKANPDAVLMISFQRGLSMFSDRRWETKRFVLMLPDATMREVQARPGYR